MVARLSEPGAALLSYENLLLPSLSTQWRPSQRSCHIHVTARETFPFMRSIEGGTRQRFLDWIELFDLEVWGAGRARIDSSTKPGLTRNSVNLSFF